MSHYSLDLRNKVIDYIKKGNSVYKTSNTFGVAERTHERICGIGFLCICGIGSPNPIPNTIESFYNIRSLLSILNASNLISNKQQHMKSVIHKENNNSIYFLTFVVKNWYYLFDRNNRFEILSNTLKFFQENKGLKIFGYVFMLNHILPNPLKLGIFFLHFI